LKIDTYEIAGELGGFVILFVWPPYWLSGLKTESGAAKKALLSGVLVANSAIIGAGLMALSLFW